MPQSTRAVVTNVTIAGCDTGVVPAQVSVDSMTVGGAGAEEEDAREAGGLEAVARVAGAASSGRCVIVPVRSLLTKKIAPPPSLAWLSSITVPAMRSVKTLPSV